MTLNHITYKEIERLTDVQLSALLLRLLLSEAEKYKYEGADIVVPLRINVSDAGEDGRIKCADSKSSQWVVNKWSIYQCKATDLNAKGYYDEFFQKDKKGKISLKAQIEEVLDNGGQYVFFTHKAYNDSKLKTRIKKAKDAIDYANANLGKSYTHDQVRILEGNRITIWTNEYISAVTLVSEYCNSFVPFAIRTWQLWVDTTKQEYKLDFVAGVELNKVAKEVIELASTEKVIRIIGHSGIGKSRLVQQIFSPVDYRAKTLSGMLVYIDLAFFDSKDVASFVINNIKYHGIIVLDNCPESIHSYVAAMIRSTGNLKLITIDHAIETQEEIFYKLDKEIQGETVELIIKNKYKGLFQDWIIEKLIELAGGYPKMADYICSSVDKNGYDNLDLTLPKEEILNAFIKKMLFGHETFNKEEYSVLQACSIFKEFGFIDHSVEEIAPKEEQDKADRQIQTISSIACIPGLDSKAFYSYVLNYKNRREVIGRKGYSYYVKPELLASNLAADWLLAFNLSDIVGFAHKLNEVGLLEQFCSRLQSLDQIPRARVVVQKLWGKESPFASAEVLKSSMGSRLFRSVVDVNPDITVKALRSMIEQYSIEEIKEIKPGRRNLIWAIEKLLYRTEAFYDAAKTLFDFAVAENETIGNNATNQFLQLFHIYLPATVVSYKERIEILKYGLSKRSIDYSKIVILALGHALKSDSFHRTGGADHQGLNKVFVDYVPKTYDEIFDYWKYSIQTLLEFVEGSDIELRDLAIKQIAGSIRSLFTNGQENLIVEAIKKVYSIVPSYWEEGIRALNLLIEYSELDGEKERMVRELLSFITPNDITNQFRMYVSKPDWKHIPDGRGDYVDVSAEKVESFVKELYKQKVNIRQYFSLVLEGEQRQGFYFGMTLGKVYANQLEHGRALVEELKKIKVANQNPSALGGLIHVSSDEIKSSLIADVLEDTSIAFNAFYLMRVAGCTKDEIFKLFPIVDREPDRITLFNNFIYDKSLAQLTVLEVIDLCRKIAKYNSQGEWMALTLMVHYCYKNEMVWNICKKFIKQLLSGSDFLKSIDTVKTMDEYHWSKSCIRIIEEDNDSKFALAISKQILDSFTALSVNSSDDFVKDVCSKLIEKDFKTFWKVISKGILGKAILTIKFILGASNGSGKTNGILFNGDTDLIFNWCKENMPKGPLRIAYMMPIYAPREDSKDEVKWHPFALKMINEFGDDKQFMREMTANMDSFSFVNSAVQYYEKHIKLANQLLDHPLLTVREWAKYKIEAAKRDIKREELDDEARG